MCEENIMITSAWEFGKSDNAVLVRTACNDSFDIFDEKSMQLILFNNNVPVANGALYFDDGAYHIAHVCVVPEHRGKYIGDLLMRVLLVKAFNMGAEKVCSAPPATVKAFFEKYGFLGDETLTVTEETLLLKSKCGHDCTNYINKDMCK